MSGDNTPAVATPNEVAKRLESALAQMSNRLADVLPKGCTVAKFTRNCQMAYFGLNDYTKGLIASNQDNYKRFVAGCLEAAYLGLDLLPCLGEGYFVPYKGVVQFQAGYRGLMKLARNGGASKIVARAVYAADEFSVEYGLEERITHRPAFAAQDRGELIAAYAVATMADGAQPFWVSTRADILAAMNRSPSVQGGKNSPWKTDFEAMAIKTPVRRLCKWLGLSSEAAKLAELDEAPGQRVNEDGGLDPIWDVEVEPTPPGELKTGGMRQTGGRKAAPPPPPTKAKDETEHVLHRMHRDNEAFLAQPAPASSAPLSPWEALMARAATAGIGEIERAQLLEEFGDDFDSWEAAIKKAEAAK